jgi:hypothetical protein
MVPVFAVRGTGWRVLPGAANGQPALAAQLHGIGRQPGRLAGEPVTGICRLPFPIVTETLVPGGSIVPAARALRLDRSAGRGQDAQGRTPAGIRPARWPASTGVLDERLKVDGEQDGPVDQEIALGGGDLAAGGLLTEAGARMLQCRIYCEHSSHLP